MFKEFGEGMVLGFLKGFGGCLGILLACDIYDDMRKMRKEKPEENKTE